MRKVTLILPDGYDEADRCGVWQHRAEALKLIGEDENESQN